MPGYLVQCRVRSGAQSKSPVSVKVTDAGPYKGVGLSDNYYTTNRTGGLYTNEHQKNEIERLWDYAGTGSRTQRNGKR